MTCILSTAKRFMSVKRFSCPTGSVWRDIRDKFAMSRRTSGGRRTFTFCRGENLCVRCNEQESTPIVIASDRDIDARAEGRGASHFRDRRRPFVDAQSPSTPNGISLSAPCDVTARFNVTTTTTTSWAFSREDFVEETLSSAIVRCECATDKQIEYYRLTDDGRLDKTRSTPSSRRWHWRLFCAAN